MADFNNSTPEDQTKIEKVSHSINVNLPPEEQAEREEYDIIPTLNGMGYMYERYYPNVNEYLQAYFNNIPNVAGPVLDIGVAYGVTVQDALLLGAEVIANEIYPPHLDIVKENVPELFKDRVTFNTSRFPNETNFEPNSLGAILASRVFNFLSGEEIEEGLEKMFTWLKPGGKVYVIAETIHKNLFQAFIAEHIKRKSQNHYWPGEMEDLHSNMPKRQNHLPNHLHFLDENVLNRSFQKAGFLVEKCSQFSKKHIPEDAILDGKETVGIIGMKPAK